MPDDYDPLALRKRLTLRAELAKLPDHKLVQMWKQEGSRDAKLVWQNRDPLERARPTGGGMFSFAKPIGRAAGRFLSAGGGFALMGQFAPMGFTGKLAGVGAKALSGGNINLTDLVSPLGTPFNPDLVKGVQTVSLLDEIAKGAQRVGGIATGLAGLFGRGPVPTSAQGRITNAQRQITLPPLSQMDITRAGVMSILPGIGAVGRGAARQLPGVVAGAAAGALFSGGGEKKKYRRMNPLNVKAARRAIRRIKAVRKITRDIEKSLPTRTVRRAVPSGHRSRLSHK